MLKLTLELLHPEQELSGFELGHVTMSGALGQATSKDRSPNQAGMVFVAAADLLDQFTAFVEGHTNFYQFVFADSSFSLDFHRTKNGQIEISNGRIKIDRSDESSITHAIFAGCSDFLEANLPRLPEDDPVRGDAAASLRNCAKLLASM